MEIRPGYKVYRREKPVNSVIRRTQRGNSFLSFLLAVVVFFGGIGFYYFNYYQWGQLERPLEGLVTASGVTGPQLNDFRKKAVSQMCDPTRQQLERLDRVRKDSKIATRKSPDFSQDCTEIKNSLKSIMAEAHLKRIPDKFEAEYSKGLMGIHYTYLSLLSLQKAVEAESKHERLAHYKRSKAYSSKAGKCISESREYFAGEGWKE